MTKKTILITGASGCLGRVLTTQLRSQGVYKVYASSRNLREVNIDFALDVCDSEKVKTALQDLKPDIVFHLAATYSKNFEESYRINFASAKQLLDVVVANHLSDTRIMLIGSAAEYGMVEKQDNPINEHFRLSPITTYGLTKSFQSLLTSHYHNTMQIDVLYSRIFNLYGNNMDSSLLPGIIFSQIKKYKDGDIQKIITGDLSQYRDFISVESAAFLLEKIALLGKSGEIYNIGTGNAISCRQFVSKLLSENGLSENVVLESKQNLKNAKKVDFICADMSKTRELLRGQ